MKNRLYPSFCRSIICSALLISAPLAASADHHEEPKGAAQSTMEAAGAAVSDAATKAGQALEQAKDSVASALSMTTKAPAFTLMGIDGKKYSLSDFAGKTVVLEWFNEGCPFVQKFYTSGKMQELQKMYTDKGVVWLSVASSAPGKQGNMTAEAHKATQTKWKSAATNLLLDESGEVGKKYGAKTTPHMYVIAPDGTIAYQGAIDDQPSTEVEDIGKAKNYVTAALDAVIAGKAVEVKQTTAYGCSVKYAM